MQTRTNLKPYSNGCALCSYILKTDPRSWISNKSLKSIFWSENKIICTNVTFQNIVEYTIQDIGRPGQTSYGIQTHGKKLLLGIVILHFHYFLGSRYEPSEPRLNHRIQPISAMVSLPLCCKQHEAILFDRAFCVVKFSAPFGALQLKSHYRK